jgi:hypothetical protein
MSLQQKLKDEIKALTLAGLYFTAWISALLLLKDLLLAEYDIAFEGWSVALVGALVLSKVVLILEHAPLGAWIRAQPAWVDVVLRTALYSFGVAVVLVLEKGFEARHEHGGFGPAVAALFQQRDIPHVWVNTLCLSGALFGYNVLSVVRRHLGVKGLRRMFLSPLPTTSKVEGETPA